MAKTDDFDTDDTALDIPDGSLDTDALDDTATTGFVVVEGG